MLTTPPKALQLPTAGWWSSSLGSAVSSFSPSPSHLGMWRHRANKIYSDLSLVRVHSTSLTCKIHTELRADSLASCFDADQERVPEAYCRQTVSQRFPPCCGSLSSTESRGISLASPARHRFKEPQIPDPRSLHLALCHIRNYWAQIPFSGTVQVFQSGGLFYVCEHS